MKLLLATRNEGKLAELKELLAGMDVEIVSLTDMAHIPDVIEDKATFLGNARKKARAASKATGLWVLADDSGLTVEELSGAPGVMSARYAGKQGDYAANNRKLLKEMEGVLDDRRGAAFVCTMVLISPEGREWDVEGRCEGQIAHILKGSGGFGYDPLFYIPTEGATMAEIPMSRKNEISHRGQALRRIKKILVEVLDSDAK